MPEQRAKGYGNWEDRLPSPFLKVLGFWGESNTAWQKCLCAATLGRREESSGNLMKTGQALYIRPHGELWIIRAADKPRVCNAKLKTTKYGEHRSSAGADALLVWARASPGASLHPIPCREPSILGHCTVPPSQGPAAHLPTKENKMHFFKPFLAVWLNVSSANASEEDLQLSLQYPEWGWAVTSSPAPRPILPGFPASFLLRNLG